MSNELPKPPRHSPEYQALFEIYARHAARVGAAFIELELPIDELRRRVDEIVRQCIPRSTSVH
jgi:hypothetical protein